MAEDADHLEKRILSGSLHDLPPMQSSVIRIFLSSTFTDYSVERNMLMKEAVPPLRQYCQEHGLDFQIADMRWGIRDDVQNDHNTTALCLREVEICQKFSRGPYFVCFLGNKYGSRPYPNVIESSEYNILRDCAADLCKDVSLMDEWYMLNANAVPSQHILLSITAKFPYYNDESEENQERRVHDVEQWNAVNALLTDIFRAAADEAYARDLISKKIHHKYFWSVTENEIDVGILSAHDTEMRTICFRRRINNINPSDKKAKRFEDLEGHETDEEAQKLLNHLKEKSIPQSIPVANIHDNTVHWTENGIDETNTQHSKYLEEVKKFFIEKVQEQIEFKLNQQDENVLTRALQMEVLSHGHFCIAKNYAFMGRENLLQEIRTKLTIEYGEELSETEVKSTEDDGQEVRDRLREETSEIAGGVEAMGVSFTMEQEEVNLHEVQMAAIQIPKVGKFGKPLIIYGCSGTGKTALMAHIASEVDCWFAPRKPVKILRFLGTSPQSCSISETLVSVCKQIQIVYEVKSYLEIDFGMNYSYLFAFFKALLHQIDTSEKPLVILLDSVDQLHGNDQAFSMAWLPCVLPPNVFMIISMIPDLHGCLKNTKNVLPDESQFLEVTQLESQTASAILDMWLKNAGQKLTPSQMTCCLKQFAKCPQPLFLKLVYQESLLWKSYTAQSDLLLGNAITDAISLLFDRMEEHHGKILVEHALGYLTASKNGMTDAEMEDVLSCDDEVLQDTYLYHLPPDENNIRLAPLLWRRLCLDLREYLISQKANKKDIVTWYHRQFVVVARERFVSGERAQMLHSGLVDYFTGKWSDQVKPLELYKKKKGSYPNAYRQVMPQPICFKPRQPNLRKLEELPYHLICSSQFDQFVELICRDFKFLYAKCKFLSLTDLMNDFSHAGQAWSEQELVKGVEQEESSRTTFLEEIRNIRELLIMGAYAIRKDPNNLPLQLLGQLRSASEDELPETMVTLRAQVARWVEETHFPLLVPHTQCLPMPSAELKTSIDIILGNMGDAQENEKKLALSADGKTLLAVEKVRGIGDVLRSFDLEEYGKPLTIQHMPGKDIKWFKTINRDRYLFFDVYKPNGRDKYNPKFSPCIVDHLHNELVGVPHGFTVMNMSPCSKWVFISQDSKYSLFSLKEQKLTDLQLPEEIKEIQHAIFSLDSTYLVTLSASEYIVWTVESGKQKCTLEKCKSYSFSHRKVQHRNCHVLPQGRFIGPGLDYSTDSTFCIWDLETGMKLQSFKGHEYSVDIMSLNENYTKAVTGTIDTVSSSNKGKKFVRVWDLISGTQVSMCKVEGPYTVVTFCGPHDTYVLTSLRFRCDVTIWYTKTEEAIAVHHLYGHTEALLYAAVALDGKILITAAKDNTIKMWSMEYILKTCEQILIEHSHVEDMASVLNEAQEAAKEAPAKHGQGFLLASAIAASSDGKVAAVGTKDGWLIFYDLETAEEIRHVKPDGHVIQAVLATQNGKHFVSASTTACLWDCKTGDLVQEFGEDSKRGGQIAALTETSGILIVAYGGMECYGDVYDLSSGTEISCKAKHLKIDLCIAGELLHSLQGLYGFSQVAITPDATKAVTTLFDYPMIFDLHTGQPLKNISQSDTMMGGCTCLLTSPDGKLLVSGSTDGSVRVTDLDGNYLFRMQHRSSVTRACFSPDSKQLLTAGFRNILVWSMDNGKLLYSLSRHTDFVTKMIFVCDGAYLVTCGKDKQILIWDMSRKVTVASFYASGPVEDICVARDLSFVIYTPENVAYLGILRPNPILQRICKGEATEDLPEGFQKAQAVALTFSSQKVASSTSQTCALL